MRRLTAVILSREKGFSSSIFFFFFNGRPTVKTIRALPLKGLNGLQLTRLTPASHVRAVQCMANCPGIVRVAKEKIPSKKTGMDYNVTILSLLWPYAFQMTSTKASHAKRFFGTPWRGEGYSYPVVVVDVQQLAHCLYNGHPSRHTLCMYS